MTRQIDTMPVNGSYEATLPLMLSQHRGSAPHFDSVLMIHKGRGMGRM
jgi:hypothetical protein